MVDLWAVLLATVGSGFLATLATLWVERRPRQATVTSTHAEATSTIVGASTALLEQVMRKAELAELENQRLASELVELRREIEGLREGVNSLAKQVWELGSSPVYPAG